MGKADGNDAVKGYGGWYWLAALAAVALALYIAVIGSETTLAYSEFKKLLYAGKLSHLMVSETMISGTLQTDELDVLLLTERARELRCGSSATCPFHVVRVADPALVPALEQAGVQFAGQDSGWFSSPLWWMLPIALVLWLPGMMARTPGAGGGSVLGIGRSHARMYALPVTGVSFADVAGIDEAKEELMELVEFLRNPERYRRLGGRIPKGVLIVGAPGTGKTLLAKAVAGEAGVPFFSISGSEFVEMFVGVGAARVRDLFAQAVAKAPCIIFIDELDALGRARGIGGFEGGAGEQEQTLNQLLVEMDGFDTNSGVILLAATNRPEILDPALLRPGRFDRHIALDRPDLAGRKQILAVHMQRIKTGGDIGLAELAARTAGFAGADLASLVNEAALLAGRKGKDVVELADFDEALERMIAGLEKKTRVMSRTEKETVAYHEAGHALIAESRVHADRVARISIIPRGIAALGYTRQLPAEDRYLLRKTELLDKLDVLLGGRVAEELVFGDVSTGAQNDLQQATQLAHHMVLQYGMSERLGLATYAGGAGSGGYPGMGVRSAAYSDETARVADAEVAGLLAASRQRVRESLQCMRAQLDALAQELLVRESVDRTALDALLARFVSREPGRPPLPPAVEAVQADAAAAEGTA
ncbi:ATP-dependent zinc metalloprotease FtsH [Pseudoduganella ginsengisoli]|uniref:ATP-dependent zinc metalloprotease FtsH n=1 Tax=Pseudoduganella ginsengisoli TaxID=1462440 RepID=A0A6L6Q571_9BURK|nr:ATP-dependent zinc metalloprotease FtsH [Pseudoduganella ginsengisoli]MTW04619.1 ATP-dependent zinc metalloprotease FtsH [Pseudoduganella ginsengisoli]